MTPTKGFGLHDEDGVGIRAVRPEPISDEKLAEIRAGLEGVTPGPWSWDRGLVPPDGPERYADIYADGGETIVAFFNDHIAEGVSNAAHIANCDSPTISALLARLDKAESEIRAAVGMGPAGGCCSAITPCAHQRQSPTTICDTCSAAAEAGQLRDPKDGPSAFAVIADHFDMPAPGDILSRMERLLASDGRLDSTAAEIVRSAVREIATLRVEQDEARAGDDNRALSEGGWQPIETAPKDWSDVLLFEPGYTDEREVFEGFFDKNAERWRDGRNAKVAPTHWMPLPPPPGSTARTSRMPPKIRTKPHDPS